MKKYSTKKILIANGAGYGNTGDEAQINESLNLFTKRYPEYQVVGLTPNVSYSKSIHGEYFFEYASRVLFYNQGRKDNCYDFRKSYRKIKFIIKSLLILFNAILVKFNLPTLFINSEVTKFLYELKHAELFYFSGGGYLTGATVSRLWDGIVLCKLCDLYNTPVVMSGQTIGVWRNWFNKTLAKWGFKNVKTITVRDEEFSLKDLAEIGLRGDKYFATHDDALFCKKSEEKQIDVENYLTINFHYWGMDEKMKSQIIDKINNIINYLTENTDYNFVFIPMVPSDKKSFDDYIAKYPNARFTCFEYDYDFKKVRRVIADSKYCITMKHHPIIFAMGEDVPALSLAFSDYYVHKNLGALAQYKMDEFSVSFEDAEYLNKFKELFNKLLNSKAEIVNTIQSQKVVLKARKDKFLEIVDSILLK